LEDNKKILSRLPKPCVGGLQIKICLNFRYAKNERTIILAVIPANQDMALADAL
jgi:hypothetical protein